jgi:hypothetical protein
LHAGDTNATKLGPKAPSSNQNGAKGVWVSGKVEPTSVQVAAAVGSNAGVRVGVGASVSASAGVRTSSSMGAGPEQVELELSSLKTTITATDPILAPLTTLLSEDIYAMSGVRLNTSAVGTASKQGDLRFAFVNESTMDGGGTVLAFEQHFALEDVVGSHACSLEALASV